MGKLNDTGEDALLSTPTYNSSAHNIRPELTLRRDHEPPTLNRTPSHYNPLSNFALPKGENRHYQQQYADMYFARLAQLKPAADAIAAESFAGFEIAGETASRVDRVLDVRQGELCWVTGTVYMELPLKPNILDDIGKEHWIAAPPPRVKFLTPGGGDQTMLEDESGRLRLVGAGLKEFILVTGAIISVLGTENADGDFEVIDLRVPDLPRQPQRWERDDAANAEDSKKAAKREKAGKVAIVSGLRMSGDDGDTLGLDLLAEYLLGEASSEEEQKDTAGISRLIIAGNSVNAAPIPSRDDLAAKKTKKYGYDSSTYNPVPTDRLDTWLASILPSIPVTLLPGDADPTSIALPQPSIHQAMFPHSRAYMELPTSGLVGSFDSATNPYEFDLDGWRFVGSGGQTVDDVFRYLPGDERLEMMEAMLRWRLWAPTAPDTLWCYPYQDGDAFVMKECPHVFFVGNQPKFETVQVEGPLGQIVRAIAVPEFSKTGEVVLLDLETLETEVVTVGIFEG